MAIYKPTDKRDPHHWAIYIHGADESIQQLVDKKAAGGYKVEAIIWGKAPSRSSLLSDLIPVGTIKGAKVTEARNHIQAQHVDNVSHTWNCQNWAMEALQDAAKAGLINLDASAMGQVQAKHENWQ
jgi:hypothetical protein